jgi:hypothetical protein
MKRRRFNPKIIAISVVFAAAFVPIVAAAVWHVLHGRGAEVYTNVYGLAIHYTSVLIMVAALVLTLAVAYIARLVYFWRYGHGEVAELRGRSRGRQVSSGFECFTKRLTIGSSDRAGRVLVESRRESMIGIKCLRLTLAQPRVAQPHR